MSQDGDGTARGRAAEERRQRLTAALRANLSKRRAQARARGPAGADSDAAGPGGADGPAEGRVAADDPLR